MRARRYYLAFWIPVVIVGSLALPETLSLAHELVSIGADDLGVIPVGFLLAVRLPLIVLLVSAGFMPPKKEAIRVRPAVGGVLLTGAILAPLIWKKTRDEE